MIIKQFNFSSSGSGSREAVPGFILILSLPENMITRQLPMLLKKP
jgi:hypothetical protein